MDMVGKLIKNPNVCLVHQMPFTLDAKGVAAAVEKVSLSSRGNLLYSNIDKQQSLKFSE